jgi:hypothetical protein
MTEFAVGDRVEFLQDAEGWAYEGSPGVITEIKTSILEPSELLLTILLDIPSTPVYAYGSHVKHIEATPIPQDFRFFRRTDGAISESTYPTFEAALEGWRGFAQNGDQTEIIEVISHGTYKAVLKVEEA